MKGAPQQLVQIRSGINQRVKAFVRIKKLTIKQSFLPAIHVVVESHHSNILIHINDNGPGVPELIQEKLFNPFFTTKDSGTGLGLSICKNLIQKLDGNISYRNCKTGGAQFSLSLPFVAL